MSRSFLRFRRWAAGLLVQGKGLAAMRSLETYNGVDHFGHGRTKLDEPCIDMYTVYIYIYIILPVLEVNDFECGIVIYIHR